MPTRALSLIDSIRRARAHANQDPRRAARLRELQTWQLARLRATYEDCMRTPRYRAALEFFMQDLYGPHDFSRRDLDLKKVLQTWERVLPEKALSALEAALELEALTHELDTTLLDALGNADLSTGSYAKGYRQANRLKDRQRQIWLITSAGRALDALIVNPWIGKALRLARAPARLAGVAALHDFLERGHAAFAGMGGSEELLRLIERRETIIMKNLFAGTPNPFEIHVGSANAGAG